MKLFVMLPYLYYTVKYFSLFFIFQDNLFIKSPKHDLFTKHFNIIDLLIIIDILLKSPASKKIPHMRNFF